MSLRLRLGLWYGALTGLLVVLVTLLTYALHTRDHYDDMDRVLVSVARHVAQQVSAAPPMPADHLEAMPAHHPDPMGASQAWGLVLRLHAADGRQVEASPTADLAPTADPRRLLAGGTVPAYDPLVGLAPSLAVDRSAPGVLGLATDAAGARWRLYGLPLPDGRTLVAAMPLDRVDASVAWFRTLVPLVALLGAGLALAAAVLLAGHALRPVAVLTESAGAIAASRDFAHRVPAPRRQDELGDLARTFNLMLGSLDEAFQKQKQFVADASHELRAPLTAIQGNLELVRRHPEMPLAERQEAIEEASREAERLTQLVADLLALARADAGVGLRRQRVELDRVLLDAVGQARHLARGQALTVDALEPVQVDGDPDRLKQLAIILLDNAVRYTPDDGRIGVSLRRDMGRVVLAVQDSGIGIPPDDLPHVFERFYRADKARSRDAGGTGLGLTIARWIAEQHRGAIHLSSESGRGTRATVTLPLP